MLSYNSPDAPRSPGFPPPSFTGPRLCRAPHSQHRNWTGNLTSLWKYPYIPSPIKYRSWGLLLELHLVPRQISSQDLLHSYSLNVMNGKLELTASILLGSSCVDWSCWELKQLFNPVLRCKSSLCVMFGFGLNTKCCTHTQE